MSHIFILTMMVWGSLAGATGAPKSLCEQMAEAAANHRLHLPFEIEFVQGTNSQSIMAFEIEGEGKMAWEIEFVLTGFNRQILRIKAYRRNMALNFDDANIPRILLSRILSVNPQVQMIRETWIADELPEVIRALKDNKTPREAVESTFRAKLYKDLGFKNLIKVGLDFDERDSMILFDADFATDAYQAPKHEPELTQRKDTVADDKKAELIRRLLGDMTPDQEKAPANKSKPEDKIGN